MKRCVKLVRKNKGHFYIPNSYKYICKKGLMNIFDIPKKTETIWLHLRKSPAKDFYPFKIEGYCIIEFDGEEKGIEMMIPLLVSVFGKERDDYRYGSDIISGFVKVEYE